MSGENLAPLSFTHNPQPSLKMTAEGNGYPSDALREGECGAGALDSPLITLIEARAAHPFGTGRGERLPNEHKDRVKDPLYLKGKRKGGVAKTRIRYHIYKQLSRKFEKKESNMENGRVAVIQWACT